MMTRINFGLHTSDAWQSPFETIAKCVSYNFLCAKRHFEHVFADKPEIFHNGIWTATSSENVKGKGWHFVIGCVELIPVIGHIVSLVERFFGENGSLPTAIDPDQKGIDPISLNLNHGTSTNSQSIYPNSKPVTENPSSSVSSLSTGNQPSVNPSEVKTLKDDEKNQVLLETEDDKNAMSLVNQLNAIVQSPSWEKEKINLLSIRLLIRKNRRLLHSQTENPKTGPQLKSALLALSSRITKEAESVQVDSQKDCHKLAFKVQCCAQGIYTEPEVVKHSYSEVPHEIMHRIFSYLTPRNLQRSEISSNLADVASVSKTWKESALAAKKNWINEEGTSLRTFGCKTAKQAVEMIIQYKLTSANLSDFPDLEDEDLMKLSECSELRQLFVASKEITEEKLTEALFKFEKLTTLSITDCKHIRGEALCKSLSTLKDLEVLKLDGCERFKEIKLAEALLNLKKLTTLSLSRCRQIDFEKALRNAFSTLKDLEVLNLSECGRDYIEEDKLAKALSLLNNLRELSLFKCSLIGGDKLVEAFSQLTNLRTLDLSFNSQIEEGNLAKMLCNLKNLTKLSLYKCEKILGEELAATLSTLINLEYLNLAMCTQIEGSKLIKAISFLKNLTFLDLRHCYKIPKKELVEALSMLRSLEVLELRACFQNSVEDGNLVEAFSNLTNLTFLNLDKCFGIPREELFEAVSNLTNLTTLDLSGCAMDEQLLAPALSKLTNLTTLDLFHCRPEITPKILEDLRETFSKSNLVINGSGHRKLEELSDFTKVSVKCSRLPANEGTYEGGIMPRAAAH